MKSKVSLNLDHRAFFVDVRKRVNLEVDHINSQTPGHPISQQTESADSTVGDFVLHASPAIFASCIKLDGNVDKMLDEFVRNPDKLFS